MAGNYERSSGDSSSGDPDLLRFKQLYKEDLAKTNKWRKEAKEDYGFRDGHQWNDEDKQVLESQGRQCITFNRTGVIVDAVVGAESSNRREVRYIPRDTSDSLGTELLTSAAEWFRDQNDAEDEESEAFKDTVTAGMGWTETRLDRTNNPDGDPKIERLDPMEMVWDHCASKANLVDAKRLWRVRDVSIEEARKIAPGVPDELLHAAWANDEKDDDPARHPPKYDREATERSGEKRRKVTLVHCQYAEDESYYKALVILPPAMQPQEAELSEAKFKLLQKNGLVLESAKLKRQVVKQCFLGNKVLKAVQPTPTGTFTWTCITGLKDEKDGTFYGIVRRAKDPQRWANKWLSQILHILNSQAKGGILAEKGAFENPREAEESWARTDRITFVNQGVLAANRIQPKPMAQFPAGFDRLMAYADEMITKATGVNMELLGIREVNQPGVLEYQRKQAGMGILATFFDALRRYRKIQGRTMLKFIQKYLADGRLVRIVGPEKEQYVPLTKEAVANIEYDIIVDDAPTSPNEKEKTWQVVQAMMPFLKDQIGPSQMMVMAKYSPLPASFVEEMKKSMGEQQQDPQAMAQQQMAAQQMALEGQRMQVEMAKIEADREKTAVEAQKLRVDSELKVMEQETERMRIKVEELAAMAAFQQPQTIGTPRPN